MLLEIESLLKEVDDEFIPSLSSLVNLAEYSQKLHKNATIFSNHDRGKLVALLAVYRTDTVNKVAYCPMLAVAKTHRSYGLGASLVRSAIELLKKTEFRIFRLEVYKTNLGVLAFYKKLGFSIESETESSVFLELNLDQNS
ncbi:GNAT family N-acetyltransferase [Roseateles saccharophilus]|uniref:Acetyltransferase (GNAT) family protein n=2 Tax=Roseateles saccharophilus TaxID=304 RepID=A0A4R3U9Y5_ROSSA|nr:acetyltransferase (GNAT) family protein [Roseateles saccharophilus]